jgi:hypothetical protein
MKELASIYAADGTLRGLPSFDSRKIFCAADYAPTENDGSCEMMFAALCKALTPTNVTTVQRTLAHCEIGAALVLSVAPLVREANVRSNDLVILCESDVSTSLNVIHSNFGGLNSDSSRLL